MLIAAAAAAAVLHELYSVVVFVVHVCVVRHVVFGTGWEESGLSRTILCSAYV